MPVALALEKGNRVEKESARPPGKLDFSGAEDSGVSVVGWKTPDAESENEKEKKEEKGEGKEDTEEEKEEEEKEKPKENVEREEEKGEEKEDTEEEKEEEEKENPAAEGSESEGSKQTFMCALCNGKGQAFVEKDSIWLCLSCAAKLKPSGPVYDASFLETTSQKSD